MMNFIRKIFKPRATVVKASYNNNVMTVEYSDGEIKQYKGSCTVWHMMPTMERCQTHREHVLHDIWAYIDHYGNSYPNAH